MILSAIMIVEVSLNYNDLCSALYRREKRVMLKMKNESKKIRADIKLLVLDVDGVLTDGSLTINADGTESKSFSALDGHGIRLWRRAGLKVAFLSGRFSEPTKQRAAQLEIDFCFQNCHNKLEVIEKLIEQLDITAENIAYVGDDLMDLPVLKYVGFAASVENAVDETKHAADYITQKQGGAGAVREVIEYILKNTGKWEPLMQRYIN